MPLDSDHLMSLPVFTKKKKKITVANFDCLLVQILDPAF